jgi:hypothetical protein
MWKSISWLISIFLSLYGRKTEKDMKGWSHGLNLRAVRRKPCEALDWPRWHLESGQTSPTLGIHIPPSTREWRGRKLTLRTKYSDTILQPLFPYPQSHLSSCQCWLSINSVSLLLVPFYTEENGKGHLTCVREICNPSPGLQCKSTLGPLDTLPWTQANTLELPNKWESGLPTSTPPHPLTSTMHISISFFAQWSVALLY